MNPLTPIDCSKFVIRATIEFKKVSWKNTEESKGSPNLETPLWRLTSNGFLFGSKMLSF